MNAVTVPVSPTIVRPDVAQTPPVEKNESGKLFADFVSTVNQDQLNADATIQNLVEQKPGSSVQQVVVAMAKAEMSFQFLMEVRNQLVDSYNELMRMQF